MTKLSLANNKLATASNAKGAGEALGDMLNGNLVLKELDVSGNAPSGCSVDGASFAVGISQGLPDNGALAKFVFSGDDNSKSVTMKTTMTVADFSSKGLGVSGAIMVAAFLPKCT
jgi:hypothetical protein